MIDSHVHLQEYIRPKDLSLYMEELIRLDVTGLLCVSYDIVSSKKAAALSESYEGSGLQIAVGLHPQYISSDPKEQLAELRSILDMNKDISAIGEIGLDYRKGMPDRELQKEVFRKQLEMSLEYSLPVSIHSVSACEDTLKILHAYPDAKGIMHGYAYSAEAAKEFIKQGFRLGVGTTLLKPGAKKLPETVKTVPQEYLVTETDLPFSYKQAITAKSPLKDVISAHEDTNAFECEYFTPDNLAETAELHAAILHELVNKIQPVPLKFK